MQAIPERETERFERMLKGRAEAFGLSPEEYLRKIWYHEQASVLGEYVALSLVDLLITELGRKREGQNG